MRLRSLSRRDFWRTSCMLSSCADFPRMSTLRRFVAWGNIAGCLFMCDQTQFVVPFAGERQPFPIINQGLCYWF